MKKAASLLASANATTQLNDVLQETEEAVLAIITAASAIGDAIEASAAGAQAKQFITEQLGHIYAACGFQDISGQRIKIVLGELEKGMGVGEAAAQAQHSLMNGPQLRAQTPSQSEVDHLFGD